MVHSSEKEKIEQLRSILLQRDRVALQRLEDILDHEEQLSERITPIIEKQLLEFQEHFPKSYQLAVDKIIERKLKSSQDDLLNLLYPIMGKMIRKYIAQQLQALKESVERQIRQSFYEKIKARFYGVSEGDLIISQAAQSRVEEAYVISQHSGILLGSASTNKIIDKEMIAGMLTAIKAFVQDAYLRNDVELGLVDYGEYQIIIQDLYSYYIALAVNGQLSAAEKEDLSKQMLTFADKELSRKIDPDNPSFHLHVKEKLQSYFIKGETKK